MRELYGSFKASEADLFQPARLPAELLSTNGGKQPPGPLGQLEWILQLRNRKLHSGLVKNLGLVGVLHDTTSRLRSVVAGLPSLWEWRLLCPVKLRDGPRGPTVVQGQLLTGPDDRARVLDFPRGLRLDHGLTHDTFRECQDHCLLLARAEGGDRAVTLFPFQLATRTAENGTLGQFFLESCVMQASSDRFREATYVEPDRNQCFKTARLGKEGAKVLRALDEAASPALRRTARHSWSASETAAPVMVFRSLIEARRPHLGGWQNACKCVKQMFEKGEWAALQVLGSAGCGKTMFMAALADHLECPHYFVPSDDGTSRQPGTVLHSLLAKLSLREPKLPALKTGGARSWLEQLDACLLGWRQAPVAVIVDGLEHLDPEFAFDLLECFVRHSSRAHLVFSNRQGADLSWMASCVATWRILSAHEEPPRLGVWESQMATARRAASVDPTIVDDLLCGLSCRDASAGLLMSECVSFVSERELPAGASESLVREVVDCFTGLLQCSGDWVRLSDPRRALELTALWKASHAAAERELGRMHRRLACLTLADRRRGNPRPAYRFLPGHLLAVGKHAAVAKNLPGAYLTQKVRDGRDVRKALGDLQACSLAARRAGLLLKAFELSWLRCSLASIDRRFGEFNLAPAIAVVLGLEAAHRWIGRGGRRVLLEGLTDPELAFLRAREPHFLREVVERVQSPWVRGLSRLRLAGALLAGARQASAGIKTGPAVKAGAALTAKVLNRDCASGSARVADRLRLLALPLISEVPRKALDAAACLHFSTSEGKLLGSLASEAAAALTAKDAQRFASDARRLGTRRARDRALRAVVERIGSPDLTTARRIASRIQSVWERSRALLALACNSPSPASERSVSHPGPPLLEPALSEAVLLQTSEASETDPAAPSRSFSHPLRRELALARRSGPLASRAHGNGDASQRQLDLVKRLEAIRLAASSPRDSSHLVRQIGSCRIRVSALASLARRLAAEDPRQARETLRLALLDVAASQSTPFAIEVLLSSAERLAQRELWDRARPLFEAVGKELGAVEEPASRDSTRRRMALALAGSEDLEDVRLAWATATAIEDGPMRLEVQVLVRQRAGQRAAAAIPDQERICLEQRLAELENPVEALWLRYSGAMAEGDTTRARECALRIVSACPKVGQSGRWACDRYDVRLIAVAPALGLTAPEEVIALADKIGTPEGQCCALTRAAEAAMGLGDTAWQRRGNRFGDSGRPVAEKLEWAVRWLDETERRAAAVPIAGGLRDRVLSALLPVRFLIGPAGERFEPALARALESISTCPDALARASRLGNLAGDLARLERPELCRVALSLVEQARESLVAARLPPTLAVDTERVLCPEAGHPFTTKSRARDPASEPAFDQVQQQLAVLRISLEPDKARVWDVFEGLGVEFDASPAVLSALFLRLIPAAVCEQLESDAPVAAFDRVRTRVCELVEAALSDV
ncbi:MAG: ATP-binding protein [Candidatus Riflebacteria bacterium]|nr:ATP-binding protein [Candidatus Riflebacteria bacterium]